MKHHINLLVFLTAIGTFPICGQVSWQRHPLNPVIPVWAGDPDDPNAFRYTTNPSVLYDQESKGFVAWFTSRVWGTNSFCISHAFSPDGKVWYTYVRNPVLRPSVAFDQEETAAPSVIWHSQLYRMYYQGRQDGRYTIGLATSSDGIAWQKHPSNPILVPGPPGSWDSQGVLYMSVLFMNGTYMMWYSGRDGVTSRIGLATSTDGVQWTKYHGNPVVAEGGPGAWDAYYVEAPGVAYKDGIFYMLYNGRPTLDIQYIGLATSTDGINWTKYYGNPVFSPQSGAWDGVNVGDPMIMFHDGKFKMWYSGMRYNDYNLIEWQIGYATADSAALHAPEPPSLPLNFEVSSSYPNPFNPSTKIPMGIPETGHIKVEIFDILGRSIRVLISDYMAAGWHFVEWNGLDSENEQVSSGVYFYHAEFTPIGKPPVSARGKMTLVR